jgi:UDP-glucose 4-epimerase
MIVVVTGAAGYIGGEIVLLLKDAGHTVIGIDRRPCPRHLADAFDEFVQADFDSDQSFRKIIAKRPDAVVHCAGTSLVGPSIIGPSDYWNNNVVKTMHLLDIIINALPGTRLIFSSSAAVYGDPVMNPCHEIDPKEPISPYGQSKLAVEWMLESYHRAYGLDYVAFRFFNACGADSQCRHGQEPGATHIISKVLESIRDQSEFVLNGLDHATPDGTCIRDYVHVEDIARAHLLALDTRVCAGVYNLGTGQGTSNTEIIDVAQTVTGNTVIIRAGQKRPGDPPILTAGSDKFNQYTHEWKKHSLNDIVQHAWNWYVR